MADGRPGRPARPAPRQARTDQPSATTTFGLGTSRLLRWLVAQLMSHIATPGDEGGSSRREVARQTRWWPSGNSCEGREWQRAAPRAGRGERAGAVDHQLGGRSTAPHCGRPTANTAHAPPQPAAPLPPAQSHQRPSSGSFPLTLYLLTTSDRPSSLCLPSSAHTTSIARRPSTSPLSVPAFPR